MFDISMHAKVPRASLSPIAGIKIAVKQTCTSRPSGWGLNNALNFQRGDIVAADILKLFNAHVVPQISLRKAKRQRGRSSHTSDPGNKIGWADSPQNVTALKKGDGTVKSERHTVCFFTDISCPFLDSQVQVSHCIVARARTEKLHSLVEISD